mgnify:CR=1 FL=1
MKVGESSVSSYQQFLSERRPAVAGMFYPDDPQQLQQMLSEWRPETDEEQRRYRAALVPHAGWVYSGHGAANVWNRLVVPETTIVLCPKHRPGGAPCAVAPWHRWCRPGGQIEVDELWSRKLAEQGPHLTLDDRPHRSEHAVEVQLPLLARANPDSRLVAITIGRLELSECQELAAGLADQLSGQLDDLLLVISSDMHHFADDATNRELDQLAIDALEQLDPLQLYEVCCTNRISMCGLFPAMIVLMALRQLGSLKQARRVAYTTSAEASGDTSRVVGYAGMLFD